MKASDLELLGFTSNGAKIFVKLLNELYLTPSELSDLLGMPIQTVYNEIKTLEKMKVIDSRGSSPKQYFIVDPQVGMKGVIASFKSNLNNLVRLSDKTLDEAIESYQSRFNEGHCIKKFAYFAFHDIFRGVNFLKEQFNTSSKEIMIYNPPDDFFPEFNEEIINAIEKGIWVGIYIDERKIDFLNKFPPVNLFKGKILDEFDHNFYLDDKPCYQSEICIDEERFISVLYWESILSEKTSISSFYSPSLIVATKKRYLAVLSRDPIIKGKNEIEAEKIDFIKTAVRSGYVTKREILEFSQSKKFQLTGTDLKNLIKKLEEMNKVKIKVVKKDRGRPREEINFKSN